MIIDFRQLFPKYGIKPNGVLHIGANVGEEAPVYIELGIKRQIWVEANPEIFARLIQNVANNPEATCLCLAAGDEFKIAQFHISNNAGQSSSVLELGTHLQAHPEVNYTKTIHVPMVRLEPLLNGGLSEYNFLNIDLQGFELQALKGLGSLLKDVQWAYLEVNKEELYKGCALIGEIDEYLAGFGFKRVETKWAGNTGWGDALYIK